MARFETYRALSVKQPYAQYLVTGRKTIEVRSRNTAYRGQLLICASAKPILPPIDIFPVACAVGLIELYGVKPVEEFTPDDWAATCIPEGERPKKGFGWLMRNARRVIEIPVSGQLGIFRLTFPEGEIMEYPENMIIGEDGWRKIQQKIKHE